MDGVFISAIGVLGVGGLLAVCLRSRLGGVRLGQWAAVAGMLLAIAESLYSLCQPFSSENGAFFRLIIGIVGLAAGLHAPGYLSGERPHRLGFFWLFFNVTLGAMMAVTRSQEFVPFLLAWEVMGIASFALVAFEYHEPPVMRAAWIYLLGCEAGGLALMLGYGLQNAESISPTAFFVFLLIGFGLKIGFPLLHVWLPEAHPAAPAPVSAVMSAAMIPLGFCGLFRFMPTQEGMISLCGWILLSLGIVGALGGIVTALPQNNLKRLLAYSSVENMGIISMGVGLGLLGEAYDMPLMSRCGLFGGMIHVLNHALLKGMLFLGAGSVLKSTGSLNMDSLGGLMKALPKTGRCFALGAFGICGLPPFCGFTGELLIYVAAFYGIANGSGFLFGASLAACIALALTGGFACAVLTKATGAVFLGEPRSEAARNAEAETSSMVVPQALLLFLSAIVPLIAGFLPRFFCLDGTPMEEAAGILTKNAVFTGIFYGILLLVWLLRRRPGTDPRTVGTWDCGYARPTARMEYTGTAFVQPLLDQFRGFLGLKRRQALPKGVFPEQAELAVDSADLARRGFWNPLFRLFAFVAEQVHRLQAGYLHLYILVMVVALAAMLVWAFFA